MEAESTTKLVWFGAFVCSVPPLRWLIGSQIASKDSACKGIKFQFWISYVTYGSHSVKIDQSSWTKRPQLLYDTIESELKTVCGFVDILREKPRNSSLNQWTMNRRALGWESGLLGSLNRGPEQMCTLGQVTEVLSFLICNMKEFASSSTKCFSGSFFYPERRIL